MSEIKVNKLTPRTNCGTVTLGDSGDTFKQDSVEQVLLIGRQLKKLLLLQQLAVKDIFVTQMVEHLH